MINSMKSFFLVILVNRYAESYIFNGGDGKTQPHCHSAAFVHHGFLRRHLLSMAMEAMAH